MFSVLIKKSDLKRQAYKHDSWRHIGANPSPTFSIHKTGVEKWSTQRTYTKNGLSVVEYISCDVVKILMIDIFA